MKVTFFKSVFRQFSKIFFIYVLLIVAGSCFISCRKSENGSSDAAKSMKRYNVVWDSPSKDPSGVMPLGNGDIAAGVYAIENGDLYLLLTKNDAYNWRGDKYKTGRVRISIDPNPFTSGRSFLQTLDLPSGSVQIDADNVSVKIWADANRPVYHVEINAPEKVSVKVEPDLWKRLDGGVFFGTDEESRMSAKPEESQKVLSRGENVMWYYTVGDKSVYPEDLEYYDVEHMADKFDDPYRFNTFGNLLTSPHLSRENNILEGKGQSFDIRIHALTMKAQDPDEWCNVIEEQAAEPLNTKQNWKDHLGWWNGFWDKSWIIASDNTVAPEMREKLEGEPAPDGMRQEEDGAALVSQSYNVFRFLMACQSRGKVQTKFNGGMFTQQLLVSSPQNRVMPTKISEDKWLTHEDDRLWGRRFTYQNQRLLYWPLLRSGDFEMMQPFFDYYWELLPMRKAITKAWFGHEGAYYRENIEPTGAERDCGNDGKPPKTEPGEPYEGWYHDYYFTAGLETVAMMIDYVLYTGNKEFQEEVLVPFAREVLLFFNEHYLRDNNGKLRLDPAQVLETYWIAVNPAPDVAGLHYAVDNLLKMNAGTVDDQTAWRQFKNELPDIPMQIIDGREAIAPADKWEKKRNAENGELYPVFPFRYYGLQFGSEDIVSWTMEHRSNKDAFDHRCWTQDQIHWAYAGNAIEAADGLVHRFRAASTKCRFPLYGREGPDSCPDFDHFGAGSIALQRMLVLENDNKIFLLPAWPAEWDVDFKQHLSGGAVISGKVQDGELISWDIEPASRENDVIVYEPQK